MNNIEENLLIKKGVKPTAMRILVLKYLMQKESATGLSEIDNAFKRSDRITLYRTLKTFQQNSIVHKVIDGNGVTKYALCEEGCQCALSDLHMHFYCEMCLNTFCMPQVKVPEIAIPHVFKVNEVSFVAKGNCLSCSS